eukprot:bmy_01012T0
MLFNLRRGKDEFLQAPRAAWGLEARSSDSCGASPARRGRCSPETGWYSVRAGALPFSPRARGELCQVRLRIN